MAIELSRVDEFALLRINRPQARNALSFSLIETLGKKIDEAAASDARQQNWDDLQNMLDAVSRLSEVVGMASAQRYRNGGMKSEDVEDMLFACKDVMVAADPLRRRLRTSNR